MPPEDSHPEKEQNETEGEIQLLEFLKNIQKYEADMDSSTNEGIKFTRLNILSFEWALQLTEHLAKKHEEKAAPNDVDLTTLYLSKDLTTIYLRKEKSGEETFLKNEKIKNEIKDFQEETKILRRDFNAPYSKEEVQDMCGFIYVFYSIALVFELHFIESKEFNPEKFINKLNLNHPPSHISHVIQRAIELYEEGELATLKDVREWLEKSSFECQFNLIKLLKESNENLPKESRKNILPYFTSEKFNKVPITEKGSRNYSSLYEVSCIDDATSMLVDAKSKKLPLFLKEFTKLHHNNGRNIRICNAFRDKFVSEVKGFIVDNHRITGILFENLEKNFDEIANYVTFTREILLKLALILSTVLTKMHEMGIAYRDLKPENIMVTKTIADGSISAKDIRLIDFDNATYLGQKNTAGVGTDYYRAPEVEKGSRTLIKYNEKVDCYSLSMTLYYLMTKKLPYENWKEKKREFRYTDDSQTEHGIKKYHEYVRSYHIQTNDPPELEYDDDSYDDIKEIINMGKHADPEKRKTMKKIKRAVEEKQEILEAQEKKTA